MDETKKTGEDVPELQGLWAEALWGVGLIASVLFVVVLLGLLFKP